MTTSEYTRRDTGYVLNYKYDRETILYGVYGEDSPIFDSLAADRFASDRTVFNLGDYR